MLKVYCHTKGWIITLPTAKRLPHRVVGQAKPTTRCGLAYHTMWYGLVAGARPVRRRLDCIRPETTGDSASNARVQGGCSAARTTVICSAIPALSHRPYQIALSSNASKAGSMHKERLPKTRFHALFPQFARQAQPALSYAPALHNHMTQWPTCLL